MKPIRKLSGLLVGFMFLAMTSIYANTISLKKGWNLIGSIGDVNVVQTYNDPSKVKIVWGYGNYIKQWKAYSSDSSVKSMIASSKTIGLQTIRNGEGYWVYANKAIKIQTIPSSSNTKLAKIYKGWNLIGSIKDSTLSTADGNFGIAKIIWGYSDGKWKSHATDNTINNQYANIGIPSLQTLKKGYGYWIYSDSMSLLSSKEGVIYQTGGTLSTSGATLVIPPNGINQSTDIQIGKVDTVGEHLENKDTVMYQVSSNHNISNCELVVPNPFGTLSSSDNLEVAYTDPATNKIRNLNATLNKKDNTIHVSLKDSWTFSKATTNRVLARSFASEFNGGIMAIHKRYIDNLKSKRAGPIRMPYFSQIGGSCWASASSMLALGLQPSNQGFIQTRLNLMHRMGIGKDEGFLAIWYAKRLATLIGHGVKYESFFFRNSAKRKIIKELDKGHPVMYSGLIKEESGQIAHQILIVGYHYDSNGVLYITKLDSQSTTIRNIYIQQKWSEIGQSITQKMYLFYSELTPPASRALITIDTPTDNGGAVNFFAFSSDKFPSSHYSLTADKTSHGGYKWLNGRTNSASSNFAFNTQLMSLTFNTNNTNAEDVSIDDKISITCKDGTALSLHKHFTLAGMSGDGSAHTKNLYISIAPLINNLSKASTCQVRLEANSLASSRLYFTDFILKPLAKPEITMEDSADKVVVTMKQKDGLDIYYTTDGTDPTYKDGILYKGNSMGINKTDKQITLKARAVFRPPFTHIEKRYQKYIEPLYSKVVSESIGRKSKNNGMCPMTYSSTTLFIDSDHGKTFDSMEGWNNAQRNTYADDPASNYSSCTYRDNGTLYYAHYYQNYRPFIFEEWYAPLPGFNLDAHIKYITYEVSGTYEHYDLVCKTDPATNKDKCDWELVGSGSI